jgi:hypothetical protein
MPYQCNCDLCRSGYNPYSKFDVRRSSGGQEQPVRDFLSLNSGFSGLCPRCYKDLCETIYRLAGIKENNTNTMKQQTQCRCTDDYTCKSCSDEISKSFKQHITKEQWDELNEKDKRIIIEKFIDSPHSLELITVGQMLMTTGDMIEFLGDGWAKEFIEEGTQYNGLEGDSAKFCVKNENLCDALWEAVKYKINNNHETTHH